MRTWKWVPLYIENDTKYSYMCSTWATLFRGLSLCIDELSMVLVVICRLLLECLFLAIDRSKWRLWWRTWTGIGHILINFSQPGGKDFDDSYSFHPSWSLINVWRDISSSSHATSFSMSHNLEVFSFLWGWLSTMYVVWEKLLLMVLYLCFTVIVCNFYEISDGSFGNHVCCCKFPRNYWWWEGTGFH